MNKKWLFMTITLSLLACDGFNSCEANLSLLTGFTINAPYSYNPKHHTAGFGLETSLVVFFFNAALAYRHWNDSVTCWNDKEVDDEFTVYGGVGIAGLIQIQGGLSNAGSRMRLKSDLGFIFDWPPIDRGYPFMYPFEEGFIISPFIETDFDDKVYGVSIGLVF